MLITLYREGNYLGRKEEEFIVEYSYSTPIVQ